MRRRVAFLLVLLLVASRLAAGELRFELANDLWGIDFRHHHAGTGELYMIETMGSGVVVFDYDEDGDADVFFVDSGLLPGYEGEAPRSRLFRNDVAGGRFADATGRSGIEVTAYGMGATAGDVDGDGDLDLYVTSFGANQLLRNNGDGTFTDVTAGSGIGDPSWSASAAFGDADRDGDLDLYVTNYVDFSFDNNPVCGRRRLGIRSYCHPDVYDGLPDRFYRNRGAANGIAVFEDATREAGFAAAAGKGLGVVWSDLDGDGWSDLYVANDMTFNFQFQNQGGGPDGVVTFEDVALITGTAVSDGGMEEAGMGIAAADADGDGRTDLYVTHLDKQTNALYGNLGGGVFADRRFQAGLAEPSLFKVGFGTAFADFDHDGDLDLVVANGHIIHNIELDGSGSTYRQRNQLFENLGGGRFREVEEAGLEVVRASRGLAVGDLDLDGDPDLVISNSNEPAEVYRNRGSAPGWLRLDLVARTGNRHGIGARVELRAGGERQVREVVTASSYLSQNELTVHFGLGAAAVGEIVVRRPGKNTVKLRHLPRDRRLRLALD